MFPPEQREEWIIRQARERPAAERAALLDGACAGDAALRLRLEPLLGEPGRKEIPLATLAEAPRPTIKLEFADEPADEAVGRSIGRYKVLEKLGEGGCGVVYVAEQTEPVRRRVALKVIKLGMDTKQVVARFEAERQALALMDHPNIAKVLDGGSTETGRPYFVMELVRGIRITDYCDQNKLPTPERLDLFIKVCQAIQHAHHKGIIHRDIKPSNILVTLQEGVALPKVIDFGIAKATSGRLTEQTLFTRIEQFIGTPAYMSPEQAEMSGLDVDTRSDIYSLGVLLYELLTGRTPFDGQALLQRGIEELLLTLRDVEPPRPSARLSTLAPPDLDRVAKARGTVGAHLRSQLQGDLDWIVMKCLEKDRTRRYETANGLAADLKRHLSHEPVVARPPSRLYEFQKTLRRHKFGFAAAVALVLVLAVGVLVSAWQARIARDQRDLAAKARQAEAQQRTVADEQRKDAEAARGRAEQIAEFLSQTLHGAAPSVALGRDITMLNEMMNAAAARIEKGDMKSAPEAELRLRGTIGCAYLDLALYDAAQRMLDPAVGLARSLHAGDHLATAEALGNEAHLLHVRGEAAKAEPLAREVLEMTRRLLPGDHKEVAIALHDLAEVYRALAEFTKAEPLFREALEMNRRLSSGDSGELADCITDLAGVRQSRKDLAEAEPLCRQALEMYRRLYPGDHPRVAYGLHNLASVLEGRGDLAGAVPLYREALEICQRV